MMQMHDTKSRAGRNGTSTNRTKTTAKVGNVTAASSKRSRTFSETEKIVHLQYWFSEIWQQGTKGQKHVDQVRRLVRERLQDKNRSTPSTESTTCVARYEKKIDQMKKSRLRSKKKRKPWFSPIAERVSAAIGSSKNQFSKWWKTAVLEGEEESLPAILRQEPGEAPAAIEKIALSGMAQGEGVAGYGKGGGRKLSARPRRSRRISKSKAVCVSSHSEKPRKGEGVSIATAPSRSFPMDKAGGSAPSSAHGQPPPGVSNAGDPQLAVEGTSGSVDLVRAGDRGAARQENWHLAASVDVAISSPPSASSSGPPALDGTTEEFGSVLSTDTMSQGSMSPGIGGPRSIAFARHSPSQQQWPASESHLLRMGSSGGGRYATSVESTEFDVTTASRVAGGIKTMGGASSPMVPQAATGFGWNCLAPPGAASPRYRLPSSSTSSSSAVTTSSNGDQATLLAARQGASSSTSGFGMLQMPQAAEGASPAAAAALGVGMEGTQIATSCQPGHSLSVRPERLRAWESLQQEVEHEISEQTEIAENPDVVEILADKHSGSDGHLLGSVGLTDAVVATGADVNDTTASGRESAASSATEDSVDSSTHLVRDDGPRGSSGFFSIGIDTGITGAAVSAIGSVRPRPVVAFGSGCADSGESPSKKGRNR